MGLTTHLKNSEKCKIIAGKVKSIKVTASGCYLIPLSTARASIEVALERLKSELVSCTSLYSAAAISKRISGLCGGECVIMVGGATASDRDARILRLEDGKNSMFSAIDGGIIPGGGSILLKIATSLRDVDNSIGAVVNNSGSFLVLRS